jgi:transposase
LAVIANDPGQLLKRLRRLGRVKCCYEAGPTGFGLQRGLTAAGIDCVVVAPSLVPTRSGDHVKTDRRDAARLARFLRSGDLTTIYVPDEETEAIRDLERARGAAKKAELVARNQLGKFLLRHGRRFGGKTPWKSAHIAWLRAQHFEHEAQQRVLEDYLRAVEEQGERVSRLTKSIAELVEQWSRRPLVKALQALRGISVISATVLVAELGDLTRFGSAPELMGYLGLAPSEFSSGDGRRLGRITRAGNAHARRILTEAAWAYRFRPRQSRAIAERSAAVSPEVRRIAWRAQERLCGKYRKLTSRGKSGNKIIIAAARELAGFIWAIAREPKLLAA